MTANAAEQGSQRDSMDGNLGLVRLGCRTHRAGDLEGELTATPEQANSFNDRACSSRSMALAQYSVSNAAELLRDKNWGLIALANAEECLLNALNHIQRMKEMGVSR